MLKSITTLFTALFIAFALCIHTTTAQECYTLEESVILVEENGGSLFDLLPVKDNKQIDNIVVFQISDTVFMFGLERDGCIISYPTDAEVIVFKNTGQPS